MGELEDMKTDGRGDGCFSLFGQRASAAVGTTRGKNAVPLAAPAPQGFAKKSKTALLSARQIFPDALRSRKCLGNDSRASDLPESTVALIRHRNIAPWRG